jgi:hypothetical protein
VAQPDEGSSSFLTSVAEAGAGVTAPETLRNACWSGLDVGSGRLAFAQAATKFMAGGHIVQTTIRGDVFGELDTEFVGEESQIF